MPRVFTARRGSTTPPIPGYKYFSSQQFAGTNPGTWSTWYPEDDMMIAYTGNNVGISSVVNDTEWDATGIWCAASHSSFGNKINMFKYDTSTEIMTRPTPGASGPPNNWSDFKTGVYFHPTEQLMVGVGESSVYLESCYYVSGDIWTKHVGNFSFSPGTNVFNGGWNPSGTQFMSGGNNVAADGSTCLVFTKSGTGSGVTFTKVTTPFNIVPGTGLDACYGIAYNPVYNYVAIMNRPSSAIATLPLYKIAGTAYTRVVTDVLSASGGTIGASNQKRMLVWSPDGIYLYVGNNAAGTAAQLRAYKLDPNTDTMSVVDVVEAELLVGDGGALAISPDGKYLATNGSGAGAVIFKRQVDGTLSHVRYYASVTKDNDAPAGTGNVYGMNFVKSSYAPYQSRQFERHSLQGVRSNASHVYQCNEVSGSILDAAGGSNNLNTFIGTLTYGAAGKRGPASAITFTGSQMAYKTGQISSATQTRGGVLMIIKPNVIAGGQRNLFTQGDSSNANIFAETFITSAGELGWRSSRSVGNTAEKVTSGLGLTSGSWYSIFIRQDWPGQGSPRFWINGVEWRGTFTTATAGTGQLSDWFAQVASATRSGFGARSTTTNINFYSGDLDDLVVWGAPGPSNGGMPDDIAVRTTAKYGMNLVLGETYSQSMQKYQPIHYNRLIDPSIVAASLRDDYRADPPTPAQGGTWVGGGNTVAPTLRDADAPLTGQTSFSMLFNGTTQYLDLLTADGSLPSVRRTGTIIAWFKGIPGANGVIYGTGNGTLFSGMWLTVNAAGTVAWNLRRGTGATDEVTLTSSATVNGNWHMLAVTCDNVNNNLMYVDGVSVAYGTTIAGVATAKDWWNDITIAGTYRPAVGARRTAAATFDLPYAGRVAECAITNRTLSAAEIADLYSKRNA